MNTISYAKDEYVVDNKSQLLLSFKKYLISPMVSGFNGFCLVSFLVLTFRLLSFLLNSNEVFNLDLLDLMFGLTGFTLTFLTDFLKNFH